MIIINYPEPSFRVKNERDKKFIFDTLRKKWLLLTPEEWVRQNFVQYLIQEKEYPPSLIAIEKEIRLGDLKKRFDILVYDENHQPWMMIECKETSTRLDESVFQQALRYNITLPVPYIIITSGNLTYGWQRKENDLVLINEIPFWK